MASVHHPHQSAMASSLSSLLFLCKERLDKQNVVSLWVRVDRVITIARGAKLY